MLKMKGSINVQKRTSGVTLTALAVTIIVLLILAGISIMYALNDKGLIKEAQEAKNKIETEKEEINNLVNDIKGGNSGGGGNTEPDEPAVLQGSVGQKGETTWSGGKASIELETSERGLTVQYQVGGIDEDNWTTYSGRVCNLDHGNIVYARLWNGSQGGQPAIIEIRDTGEPTVTVNREAIASSSITVFVTSSDSQWGMETKPSYSYYIKKATDESYPTTATHVGTETTWTFSGLKQNTSYDIKVTVQDKAKNTGTGYLTNTTTETVGGVDKGLATGSITATAPTWDTTTHEASITLNTTTNMQIQWQKGGITGEWNTVPAGQQSVAVTELNHGDNVYARLYDGTNSGDEAYVTVRDSINPFIERIEVISENPYITEESGSSFSYAIYVKDNESGIDYTRSLIGVNKSATRLENPTEYQDGMIKMMQYEYQSYSFSSAVTSVDYLHIYCVDKAGNIWYEIKRIESIALVTKIEVNPPTASLNVDENLQLSATISPNDAKNKDVIWSSENPDIATVSASGLVTAKKEGSTKIIATSTDKNTNTEEEKVKGFTTITVQEKAKSAEEIANDSNKSKYYGKYVTGLEGGTYKGKWRLFYVGNKFSETNESEIYIITEYGLKRSEVPLNEKGNTVISSSNGIAIQKALRDDYENYNYKADKLIAKLNKMWIDADPIDNGATKAISYMFDQYVWKQVLASDTDFIVGGATIELYNESIREVTGTGANLYIFTNSKNTFKGYTYDSPSYWESDEKLDQYYNSRYIKNNQVYKGGCFIASEGTRWNSIFCAC